MSPSPRQEVLRKIPSVDEILSRPEISDLIKTYPRNVVVEAIRKLPERAAGRNSSVRTSPRRSMNPSSLWIVSIPLFKREIERQTRPRLRRVINATGVVIHTNLGRSPLHPSALQHLIEVSRAYSNLEYDLDRGERGSRYDPCGRNPLPPLRSRVRHGGE